MPRQRQPARRHYFTAHNRKLTWEQAECIRRDAVQGDRLKTLATRYGCDRNTIRGILDGRTYLNPSRYEREAIEERDRPAPSPAPPNDPRLVCRMERAKRANRPSSLMREAATEFAALLAREVELRKGGRPKGPANGQAYPLIVSAKAGKPQLMVQRRPAVDLVESLEPYYGRSA